MRNVFFLFGIVLCSHAASAAPRALVKDGRLIVDNQPVPYLFGAETQYFRARGGEGRNVPAARVRALWTKLVDRVQEAKMNTVVFYIPWDFHPLFLSRFREHLENIYKDEAALSAAYGATLTFDAVVPPTHAKDRRYPGARWHYDWFHFHDLEIVDYYRFVRSTWEAVGVSEREIMFTSCDSFNAPAEGLLPRLDYRQHDRLSFTTMNIYPKTFGTQKESTMNTPMKAAHDAALISSSHRRFYGSGADWVMSTETVGGWFPPVEVSEATRQHTYGSLLGAGVKAMMIYYFHEGWNWNGWEEKDSELRFDAPLDKDLKVRPAFTLLKDLGTRLQEGLGDLSVDSRASASSILLAHDTEAQYPIPGAEEAVEVNSSESAALYGMFREAGVTPTVDYGDRMSKKALARYRLVVWNHPGYLRSPWKRRLESYLAGGGTVLWIGKREPLRVGKGRLLHWEENQGKSWNTDDYPKLKTAGELLGQLRRLFASVGIRPAAVVEAKDGKPFLHVSARPSSAGRYLISVENFLREERKATLRLPSHWFSAHGKVRLIHRYGGLETRAPMVVSREQAALGVAIDVVSDGVDLWEARSE